ncbi:winged helix-turn-helix domain-containing protein [Gordonia otitidis]|uniref:Winged helix-turn-helix domain-containing protein n=1 Tax=Gordonia otitidis (strain DSM 44809 / CCUG 52243 / JCM 12355 / NBRC 100426 / IFM 10032) TaxID=1108044 RepID=H5TK92_GORO1|nr:crosslink repair DNA glycosylase YcaQ family protein [Gordonia otitidis]GAB33900.1 hypothetical protein GOOTI_087_00240 [Gordonia otitidis NBRC 100426]
MTPPQISAAQAARIALDAQCFGRRAPAAEVTRRQVSRVIERTRLIQMDSVNIAVRAHYLPLFSRLGPYDRTLLDRAAWHPGRARRMLVEYWAHEAALIPLDDWPLFGWRMEEYRDGRYRHTRELMRDNRALAADIRALIADIGPATPRLIENHLGIEREPSAPGGWWNRGDVKHLCEAMFASGELSAVRDANFGRHYDLTERVVGDVAQRRIGRADAHRALVTRAARALGVATVPDLADYYRLKNDDVRRAVAELTEDGALQQLSVHGWKESAYVHESTPIPRGIARADERSTLLSPFDPLVFFRPRAERLFGFRYRIEIYVPEHKRVHGYYVHPYLLGDEIVARVDLKADRGAGVLRVPAAHLEAGQDADRVADRLAADLEVTAHWLGLDDVEIGDRGDLASRLAGAASATTT